CQVAIAEFGPVTQVLRTAQPVPAGRPLPDFEGPTIPLRARPARAPAGRRARARRRGRDARLLAAAAAVGAAVVLVAGLVLLPRLGASPAAAVTIPLH